MKRNQSGFTLIEIAIVLVIIGLLLGGVLKGQELINSAKVKNFAADFRNIPIYIYGYQDKFRALPGDDSQASSHVSSAGVTIANGDGNGVLGGGWDSITTTDETVYFWQHVRAAGLAAGATAIPPTLTRADPYFPLNAANGRIGIERGSVKPPIANLSGSYIICSDGILGKFAKQMDIQMDNGDTATGAMMTMATPTASSDPASRTPVAAVPQTGANAIDDNLSYTVCMGV